MRIDRGCCANLRALAGKINYHRCKLGRPIDSAIPMAKSATGFRGRGIVHQSARGIRCAIRVGVRDPESLRMLITGRRSNIASIVVNSFKTNSGKDVPVNRMKNETMPAEDERRELVPVIIAGIVAAIGLFCLWADLRDDSLGRGDGVITSAVASRAGVMVTPSELPTHLVMPQTAPASELSTVGRVTR
jgi:hypothetical protein